MKNLGLAGAVIGGIVLFAIIIYGSYWAAKSISYKLFYQDMVRAEIVEMVQPSALNEGVQ
jgi:hypothetical protein